MVSATSYHESYSSLVWYHVSSSLIGMGLVVAVTESCATFMLLSSLIDMNVVVAVTDSFVMSMLVGSLVSLVPSKDTSHGSVLFQIISSFGFAASNCSTFVVGQIWCSVILVMLDPKNTSLSSKLVQTLRTLVRNLRSPPAIIPPSCDNLG